MKAVLS